MPPHLVLRLLCIVLTVTTVGAAEPAGGDVAALYESSEPLRSHGAIDDRMFARWASLGVKPAHGCSDAVFVRRVYLDVLGTLPTAEETQTFLHNSDANKRSALIDQLLTREEFADYWATKWSDLLRIKAEFPVNLWPNAAQAYHRWVRTALRDNWPYDRFVRELLVSSGSNFRVGQVNFYRATQSREPTAIARAVALSFMGVRTEKWPPERLAGMGAFFSRIGFKSTAEWKEEIVFFDSGVLSGTGSLQATFPDGTPVVIDPGRDPREVFAEWLVQPENPWFTRAIANRVWSWLLGRGIVHEPDDFSPENPPSDPVLLDLLAADLVAAKYDLKQLFRVILNSQTYQLSSIPCDLRPDAAAHFACYPLRRLDAEVLIDAIDQIAGTHENYSSAIPEPFTFIPENLRSIALPDGSITSSFLEAFGRPARDTGREAERNNSITATQELHLLNSSHIQRKIERGPKLLVLYSRGRPAEVVETLYLSVLSRPPTKNEREIIATYAKTRPTERRAVAVDLVWALLNSPEFLYRH